VTSWWCWYTLCTKKQTTRRAKPPTLLKRQGKKLSCRKSGFTC